MSNTFRKLPAATALACALLLCTTIGTARAEGAILGPATVRDGDSLRIGAQELRLWGVDAPELSQTCTRGAQRWDCGTQAKAALAAHLGTSSLVCEVVERDAYGRAVSRCTQRGRSVNAWLVRQGWAVDYRRYSGGAYAAAENEARRTRRGLWSGAFETPERYRHRPR